MTNNRGYIIAIVLLSAGFLYLWFTRNNGASNRIADALSNPTDTDTKTIIVKEENTDNQEGDIKCELRDSYGRMITITGRGAEFERLCLERRNQQQYLWGYQWWPQTYYIWNRGWRNWGGPRSGTGPGTGGGTPGSGSGAGTQTPGSGTPPTP